jgi:hypothetical protein
MKRLLIGALASLFAIAASATTLNPIQLLNPTGSTSGQAIISTGASTAPAWGGVGVNGIAAIAANTVLANATGSSASPAAFAMPSCSSGANALSWTTSTGFTCNAGLITAASVASTYAPLASPTLTGTATAAALTVTGALTPSSAAGLIGSNGTGDANTGSWGEYQNTSTLTTSLTSATAANCTSISLTAGDWNVWGVVKFTPGAGATPVGVISDISTTSATLGTDDTQQALNVTFATATAIKLATPMVRLRLSATTTVYVVGFSIFSGGTETCDGYIRARRVR